MERQDPDLPRLQTVIGRELVGGGRQHRVEDSVQNHPFNFFFRNRILMYQTRVGVMRTG